MSVWIHTHAHTSCCSDTHSRENSDAKAASDAAAEIDVTPESHLVFFFLEKE